MKPPETIMKPQYQAAPHILPIVDVSELKQQVDRAIEELRAYEANGGVFDTIAFSGMSGAIPAGAIAIALNKCMILVRKPSDVRASPYLVEGHQSCKRYIVIDDFICTGSTVQRIIDGAQKFCTQTPYCVGIYEMNRHCLKMADGCFYIKQAQKPSVFSDEWIKKAELDKSVKAISNRRMENALQKLQANVGR